MHLDKIIMNEMFPIAKSCEMYLGGQTFYLLTWDFHKDLLRMKWNRSDTVIQYYTWELYEV